MEDNQTNQGRAIPLVTYINKKFVLDPEAEELLNSPKYKNIGIISLVGKYRTGKSFLLNRVLLNQKKLGFNVGPTIRPCTKGIWIWSEPIVVENNNFTEKFNVFMIDTEGLGAYDEEINHDTKIFLIAVLISSLFIFNSFGTIDENSINSLSFILNLSQTIKLSNDSNKTNPNELAKHFPSFFWLLRDFTLKLVDQEGNKISSKQYLENCLKVVKGDSEMIEEKNKLRKLIMTYFPERDCHTLVRPLENEALLQQLMTLDDKEFRKEFNEQAESFRTKVFNKVKPKSFFGKVLSGEMVVQMLKSILVSINSGSVPVIENSWKYVCENECLKTFDTTLEYFKKQLRMFKEKNHDNCHFFSDFESYQKILQRDCLETFKQQALGTEMMEYYDKLKSNINTELKKFNDENCAFYESRLTDVLDINIKKINENLDNDQYSKNNYEFFQDIENLKDNTESSVPDFASKKDIVFTQLMTLIKKYIEVTFIKAKQSNEREIISLKNETNNLMNRQKVLNEELENAKIEAKEQSQKMNNIIMDLKVAENNNFETIKSLEKEKRILMEKNDKDIAAIKKECDIKIEKFKNDITKLDYELKIKDDQIINLNFSIDKMKTLHNQKIEFLESEVNNYKSRYDQLKSENLNLILENEDLQGKVDDMKIEVNKKRMLEFEMEKLKIKEKKYSESTTNFFSSTLKEGFSSTIREGNFLREDSNNNLDKSIEKDTLSNLIIKTNLENTKQQLEETKKVYEEVITTLKENLEDLPQNLAKFFSNQKPKSKSVSKKEFKMRTMKKRNTNKLKESVITLNDSFDVREDNKTERNNRPKHDKYENDESNGDPKFFYSMNGPNNEGLNENNNIYILKEIINSNLKLSTALSTNEERLGKLEEKVKNLKEFKHIVNSSTQIQCKHCAKLFGIEKFKTHFKLCENELNTGYTEEKKDHFRILVLKAGMKKEENGKNSYEFILEIESGNNTWKVNRKLSQLIVLNKNLRTAYPTIHLPDSTKLFFNVTDNKLPLLEKYLKGLSDINEIRKSKLFSSFLSLEDFKEQDYENETVNNSTNQISPKRPSTTTVSNNLQLNLSKQLINNPPKSPNPPTNRRKNESTGSIPKEIVVEHEEIKKLPLNTTQDNSKEAPKRMKILNVSQKGFNPNNMSLVNQTKMITKEKKNVSPMRKASGVFNKDPHSQTMTSSKSRQFIVQQSQTLKPTDDCIDPGSFNNVNLNQDKKRESPLKHNSPENKQNIEKNMSFS